MSVWATAAARPTSLPYMLLYHLAYGREFGQQQQLGGQAEPHQPALHATAGRELGDPQHLVVHVETHQAVLQSHQAPGLLQGCALGEPQYLGDPQYLGVYAIWIECSHNVSNA